MGGSDFGVGVKAGVNSFFDQLESELEQELTYYVRVNLIFQNNLKTNCESACFPIKIHVVINLSECTDYRRVNLVQQPDFLGECLPLQVAIR